MSNLETWYLTANGWIKASEANTQQLRKEQDIFSIYESARHGMGGSAKQVWSTIGSDLPIELKAEALEKKFGSKPPLRDWFADYDGERL